MEKQHRVLREMEEFDTSSDGVHGNWPDRFFTRIVDGYFAKSGNKCGRVGDAMTYVLSARELLDFALRSMQPVAADRVAADDLEELPGHS
jgi:hypothetical protein